MKFKFRLAPLVRLANLELRKLQMDKAKVESAIADQHAYLEQCHQNLAALETKVSLVTDGLSHRNFQARRQSGQAEIQLCLERIRQLEELKVEVEAQLLAVNQRIQQLEKSRQQAQTRWRKECVKVADRQSDERATLRYRRLPDTFSS